MYPGKHMGWADASPGLTAGVDTQWPRALEGCAAVHHDTDSSRTASSQRKLT